MTGHSILHVFDEQVRTRGDRLAIQSDDRPITFAELNRIADALAARILSAQGAGAEPIGLLFDRGAEVVASILAVLKAGKFYVILDPQNPRERLRYMLADSGARLVVAHPAHRELARELADGSITSLEFSEDRAWPSAAGLDVRTSPDDLAMVIYTSGSTGRPKGVMHTHRTVLADTFNVTNAQQIVTGDRFVWHTSVSFGGSARTIYTAMLNGAGLYPFDTKRHGFAQLSDWLLRHEITIFRTVPTTFRTFMATLPEGLTFPAVRILSMGGEPLFRADVESFNRHFLPHCVLVHPFGPTETMLVCWSLTPHGRQIDGNKVSVGHALPDKTVLLLDEARRPVSEGDVGEIAVRSRHLSPGYWRDPERTNAVFLPPEPGSDERTYLTGDLGKRAADGTLTHMGRRDFQVKIRGFRIELSEIETALRDIDGIGDAVVVGRPTDAGEPRLVAYFVPSTKPAVTLTEIRNQLARALPDYMIPSIFVAMTALPLTPTGKTDRLRLPDVDRTRPDMATPFTPPGAPLEEAIAQIWTEALGIDRVGIDDDFFELGGDSLMAMRLIARVKSSLHVELSLATLLEDRTVANTARRLNELTTHGPVRAR